mmetsp:Transcript_36325/g.41396  ORF Transcript_36325/g.41396 Transcript_36325/m.41396 type:complete len:99 (+) Transcript_36325:682-978(+)
MPIFISDLLFIGTILLEEGKFLDALPCWERVTELAPSDAEALLTQGVIFQHLERYSEAIECFLASEEQDPADPNTKMRLTESRKALKRISRRKRCTIF